jgi:hypothetical protein
MVSVVLDVWYACVIYLSAEALKLAEMTRYKCHVCGLVVCVGDYTTPPPFSPSKIHPFQIDRKFARIRW